MLDGWRVAALAIRCSPYKLLLPTRSGGFWHSVQRFPTSWRGCTLIIDCREGVEAPPSAFGRARLASVVKTLATKKQTPRATARVAYALASVGLKAFDFYRSCTEPYIRRETAVQ